MCSSPLQQDVRQWSACLRGLRANSAEVSIEVDAASAYLVIECRLVHR